VTSFAGSSALITGGGSGIGRALGVALAEAGAHVVLADVDAEAVERAASELGGSVRAVALDVRDADAVGAAVADVVERHGRLDLLFNNAGISLGGPTHEMPAAHWERIIDVNIRGVVNGVLAAYPRMVAEGRGHIVNTASGAGLGALPLVAAYSMTKHAVVGLSMSLRPEAASHGVRVSVLCPGAVETPILDRPPPSDLPPAGPGTLTARTYLERVGFSPMAADLFARRALRAVARNKAIVVEPRFSKVLWRMQRLSPALMDRAARLTLRRVQKG
jgi:NAD(P)-dependent dehydrogenase (short-subunit alcohol dehydrogenase family)